MSDTTTEAPQPDPAERRCTEPECESGQTPPPGYDTCEPCAWEAYFARRERQLLAKITGLEAALADATRTGPGSALAALLDRFGPDSHLVMLPADHLRAGDVFAWPWAQVRAVGAAGRGTVCVFYGHGAEKTLAAGTVHLVLRPGDTALACTGCGRDFTAGCTEDCHERFIPEEALAAVLTEAGLHAPPAPTRRSRPPPAASHARPVPHGQTSARPARRPPNPGTAAALDARRQWRCHATGPARNRTPAACPMGPGCPQARTRRAETAIHEAPQTKGPCL